MPELVLLSEPLRTSAQPAGGGGGPGLPSLTWLGGDAG